MIRIPNQTTHADASRTLKLYLFVTAVLLSLAAAAPVAAQTTWHVDDNAPADPGPGDPTVSDPAEDGSPDHPFDAIQEAIDAASDGDTVLVADGTYTGIGNKNLDYAGRLITVRSKDGPDTCIIDCQGAPGDLHRGFYFHSGETANAVVDGFTITNGRVGSSSPGGGRGAGVFCVGSSPTIMNCRIVQNVAQRGGGMYNDNHSSPMVTNCTFGENSATAWWGGGMCNDNHSGPTITNCTFSTNLADVYGGGMANHRWSSPTVTNCTFTGNWAGWGGAGMSNDRGSGPTVTDCTFAGNSAGAAGAGMYNIFESAPVVTNCTFAGNWSSRNAGGMFNADGNPTVTNCTFSGNWADWDGGGMRNFECSPTVADCTFRANLAGWFGGGMHNEQASPLMTNCTFSFNSAGQEGGGMFNDDYSSPTLTNCTITGNTAVDDGGAVSCDGSNPTLTNCILWADAPQEIYASSGAPTVTYCDIQGGWDGEGNIHADPLFVDPNGGDYRLGAGSPCIDAGDNFAVPDWLLTDLDGNPRFWDDRRTHDTGNPDGIHPIVDMGAYEFGSEGCPDDDGDGFVTICHIPPGNPERARTITVPIQAAAAHLAHGDYCGPCNQGSEGALDGAGDVEFGDSAEMADLYGTVGADCPGDLTGEDVVDLDDVAQLVGHYGITAGAAYADGDVNLDGDVDLNDLAGLLGVYGTVCP